MSVIKLHLKLIYGARDPQLPTITFSAYFWSCTKSITANSIFGSLFSVTLRTCKIGNNKRLSVLSRLKSTKIVFVFGRGSALGPATYDVTSLPLTCWSAWEGTPPPQSLPNRRLFDADATEIN